MTEGSVPIDHPLLFLRHGQTAWNVQGRYQGATDVPLSEKGREQAESHGPLVEHLCETDRLQRNSLSLVASPLSRAYETAEILRDHLASGQGMAPTLRSEPDLRELSFGRWEGLTSMEVKAEFYEERKRRKIDRFTFAPDQGDSMTGREKAVRTCLEGLAPNTIVVTHSALLRLVAHILGLENALTLPVPHEGGFLWDGKKLKSVQKRT